VTNLSLRRFSSAHWTEPCTSDRRGRRLHDYSRERMYFCLLSPPMLASNVIAVDQTDTTYTRKRFELWKLRRNLCSGNEHHVSLGWGRSIIAVAFTGTSMAAPHVAGSTTPYFQAYPEFPALEIKMIFKVPSKTQWVLRIDYSTWKLSLI
jgi:hypothetical protein